MILLALETATSVCSVALFRDERIEVEFVLNRPRSHAENLVPMMHDVLRYSRVDPSDVAAVAVSSGPGSYTGLRIGVSSAKGFATAVDASLVAVPSLEALASCASIFAAPDDFIASAFHARRGEVYAAVFRVAVDGGLRTHRETSAVRSGDMPAWIGALGDQRLWLVGDGWTRMTADLRGAGISFRVLDQRVAPSAAAVARIGAARLSAGRTEDVVSFEPYYLKEFIVREPAANALEKLSLW